MTQAGDTQILHPDWLVQPVIDPAGQASTQCAMAGQAVAFAQGRITAVDSPAALRERYPDAALQRLEGHILAPGLINAHGHAAMSLLRGYADDQPLQTWLQAHIWPAEAEFVDENFVADGVALAIADMLLSGTTCFADMYFFPDVTARIAEQMGMRSMLNFPVLEMPSAWAQSTGEYFDKGLALADEYRDSELISTAFGPHAPYTVSDESFARIAMLAEEIDCGIHVHLHETATEVADSIAQHGCSPLQRLDRLGVLSPRTQAVHMTQVDDNDLALLQRSGTHVIHCPTSNLKLASGGAPLMRLLEAGINVGLGTDSAASNNTLSLFDTLRCAALLAKHCTGDAAALAAGQALYLATLGGAHALGLQQHIGSIEVGKQADLIAIDTRCPALQPVHDATSSLVYSDVASAVQKVWISGQLRVDNRQLVDQDLNAIMLKASHWRDKLAR